MTRVNGNPVTVLPSPIKYQVISNFQSLEVASKIYRVVPNTLYLIYLFSSQDLIINKPPDHSVVWLKVNVSSLGVKESI